MAFPAHDVSALLEDVKVKGDSFLATQDDEQTRKALLEAARSLVSNLESPFEVIARMNWLEPTRWAVCRVGLEVGLFGALTVNGEAPKGVQQLAEATGLDPILMSRFMKHLYAAGFVEETGKDEYAANGISSALAGRIPAGMMRECYDFLNPVHTHLLDYLRNTNYANPTNKDATAFKYSIGTDLHYFDWLSQPGNEQRLDAFKAHMEFKTLGKKWFQTVDVAALLDHPTDPAATLLVDIGGSTGHDIIDFHSAFPDLPGALVLQDLPSIINSLPSDFPHATIHAQAHDFFTPQPVAHAKAYFLHTVLHDWPDDACRQILANIIPAMKKGYSKILLNELVMPDRGANWFATSVDMLMLLCHAAQERTESDWRALLESVGLKIVRIWDCEGSLEKVIEVEIA